MSVAVRHVPVRISLTYMHLYVYVCICVSKNFHPRCLGGINLLPSQGISSMRVYICIHDTSNIYTCMYIYIYIYIYISTCVDTHRYIIYMCVYICIHNAYTLYTYVYIMCTHMYD